MSVNTFRDLLAKARAMTAAGYAPVQDFSGASWGFDLRFSPDIDIGAFGHDMRCEFSIAVSPDMDWWICDVSIEGTPRPATNELALACAAAALSDSDFCEIVEGTIESERRAA